MKRKSIVKGIILSLSSLIVGFLAIALPFQLFYKLSGIEMNILFALELSAYFIMGIAFLLVKDKREQKRARAKRLEERHCKRIKQHQEQWINIAA